MTIDDRIAHFRASYPKQAASWPWAAREMGHDVLYAVWVIRPFPRGLLQRVRALFPDVSTESVGGRFETIHAFSGSLPVGAYDRCDLVQPAEFACDVRDLPNQTSHRWRLVVADPPYSAVDAKKYGTPMVNRRAAIAALAQVTSEGAHLVWLDTCWPIHSKREWVTVGRILVQRSTNHRARVLTIFRRQP